MTLDHLGREALAHLQGGRAVSGPGFDVCLAQMALDLSVIRRSEPADGTSSCQLLRFWRGREAWVILAPLLGRKLRPSKLHSEPVLQVWWRGIVADPVGSRPRRAGDRADPSTA